MALQSLVDFRAEADSHFSVLEENLNGERNTHLHEVRKSALAALHASDFPTIKHEEWKYTNVKKVVGNSYQLPSTQVNLQTDLSEYLIPNLEAYTVVFVNGQLNNSLSNLVDTAELVIQNLSEAYHNYQKDIDQYFGKLANFNEDTFTALNTAFSKNGIFIKVSKGKVIEKPIQIIHLNDASVSAVYAQPRILVVAEENAQLKVLENTITIGEGESFTNSVAEFVVEKYAHVDHYKIQNDSEVSSQINQIQVYQSDNSYFANTTVSMRGKLIRNNLNIALDGSYCEAYMNGLYMLNDKTHVDNHTVVDHKMPNSYSNELYKGVLDDCSTGVFNGKIFVRQDAQKTNAFQSNKNILLSDEATIDTKPQLEIWADDVKCSHGATTGALDEEPLFYLRSRGIPENQAKSLLMSAFADDILDRIKVEAIRDYTHQLIEERLG